MRYFIKEDFYFDIDKNQLRIAGPGNHLFLGLTLPKDTRIFIADYRTLGKQLEITSSLDRPSAKLTIPVVTDIRTLRTFIEKVTPIPTFEELIRARKKEVAPDTIEHFSKNNKIIIRFVKAYNDGSGIQRRYGSEILFPKAYDVQIKGNVITIKSKKNINLKIRTISNISTKEKPQQPIFISVGIPSEYLFSPHLIDIYNEAEKNIIYLLKTKKTSSFEYGTIFPRDWIESADLGNGDLSEETIDYMYTQSLRHVTESGEGWHEEVVNEFKPEDKEFIDRKMIDIEPHYILGMNVVSKKFLTRHKNRDKMRRVAGFILKNSKEKDLITFKKKPGNSDEYHLVGNWRDSEEAYPNHKSPLAPYDVNCVFYPESLKIIKNFKHFFKIKSTDEVSELIAKWETNKEKFKMSHKGNLVGYALAIQGTYLLKIKTPHLDESYDLFYNEPSMEEIVSFSEKITNPDYLYTPVGPLLVANKSRIFSKKNYHGKVIWPKQAAFAVAGLTKQYKRGLSEGWPNFVLSKITDSIITTARACFKGWLDLGTVPELYYYDSHLDRARFFTDQEDYVGQMSIIQLWSSVAARRIIRDYASVMESKQHYR